MRVYPRVQKKSKYIYFLFITHTHRHELNQARKEVFGLEGGGTPPPWLFAVQIFHKKRQPLNNYINNMIQFLDII